MKYMVIAILSIGLFFGISSAGEKSGLIKRMDKISYSVGYQVGSDFKRQNVDINPALILKGIQDALTGVESQMTQHEMRETLVDLKKSIMTAKQAELKEKANKNLEGGKAFLSENQKKEGVKTLSSGLQYKVIEKGSGETPKASDTVTVHYRGTLIDGTEFDSSYSRNKPATFPVSGVIAGWTEALQLMKEGAKWQLFIPPDLAYGERGAGPRIGPNSTLIFVVELISIKPAE